MQHSVRRIVRNSTLNLASQGVFAVCYIAVIAVLARGLGTEAFGEYFVLFALIMAGQMLVESGLSLVLTRRIARSPETWVGTVAEAAGLFVVVALASLGGFLLLGLIWAWHRQAPVMVPYCLLAGLTCVAFQVRRFCAGVFQGF